MTPAIDLLKKQKIKFNIHHYEHDANSESFGLEAAEKLSVAAERVFKTLVVNVDNKSLVVCILPVSHMLSMKHAAKACSGKKAQMADKQAVLRSTGYVLGGVSPLGQKKRLQTVLDSSALNFQTIYVSAGKRGMDLELDPKDLITLLNAKHASLCQEE
ncbi:MAG: Cys-tRNA(Pro) deacylase [Psychromonas sp.]